MKASPSQRYLGIVDDASVEHMRTVSEAVFVVRQLEPLSLHFIRRAFNTDQNLGLHLGFR